jgi:F0F1-type ATP synthase assembly protein I
VLRSARGAGDPEKRGRLIQEIGPYLSLGTSLAVTVLAGVGAGYWLDWRLGTGPTLLVVGGVVGILAAGYQFWRTVGSGGQ